MTLSTLLDPRFKTMAFFSASKANDAVKRLKSECATEIRTTVPTQMEDAEAGPSSQPSAPSSDDNLRHLLDVDVKKSRANSNVTTDAVVEVQRCISEANTPRDAGSTAVLADTETTLPEFVQTGDEISMYAIVISAL
ncbi:unnamed protein product [Tetraodon nigroviridis]|uniref:(spotted green pufferfish) hypothetical protein n=1 Tax=Tetraodon nigroviridis TaxID=99883 RepID=Q4TJ21_TETNG|nr:unnamed protein product [Tetraodon nigroviridis]